MGDAVSWILVLLAAVNALLLVFLVARRSPGADTLRDDMRAWREEAARAARESREELGQGLKGSREELSSGLRSANETLSTTLSQMSVVQRAQLEVVARQLSELTHASQESLERIRGSLDGRLKEIQEGNEKKLEEMRRTVDEKLHTTLEKRLGESFSLVSQRLEAVQRGLGEMQSLATGVGDLKKVLTNVKARGTWAEVQLGALLEQILAPGQFERNVRVRDDSPEIVEYAIRLPGPRNEPESCVWLPIDSKFPQEDYLRIQEAAEKGDLEAARKATDALARNIRDSAQAIRDKYLFPPHTTDFGIMFLATEGLYAEVLRIPNLAGELQQKCRIVIAGPSTLAAMLNSLRMGFQTLAIEQRASEVWKVLHGVKTEFSRFGDMLDKVKKHLDTATRTIEKTGTRTRAIERKLEVVEELPEPDLSAQLQLTSDAGHAGLHAAAAEPVTSVYSSRCTVSGEKAGRQTARYSAPSGSGVE